MAQNCASASDVFVGSTLLPRPGRMEARYIGSYNTPVSHSVNSLWDTATFFENVCGKKSPQNPGVIVGRSGIVTLHSSLPSLESACAVRNASNMFQALLVGHESVTCAGCLQNV
jgi:hypothetical protein